MKRTVGHVIGAALKQYGVPYVPAIPGHGNWNILDAFNDEGSDVPVLNVFHEQCAVHMADGHYRAVGKPIAAITSIGPGTANTLMGLSNCMNDSTAMLLITGAVATHMVGHGVVQELDRNNTPEFTALSGQVTKRAFNLSQPDQTAFTMHRAFNAMMTGRPGPVHIEVPCDVQGLETEIGPQDLKNRLPTGQIRPDQIAIELAIEMLLNAERPVIVAGGGTIASGGTDALTKLVDRLAIPVAYTWSGKGSLSEDHPMDAGNVGHPGTISANKLCSEADVILSLGCRFTDWSSSSWRKGVSFAIPSSRLIQVDIDAREIGKNYPCDVGIVADVRLMLEDINAGVSDEQARKARERRTHIESLPKLWSRWDDMMKSRREHNTLPTTMTRTVNEMRRVLPRNGICVVGSGHSQGVVKQEFTTFAPRTHITPGSYSPMGWAQPAALGVKLARPDAPVVCVLGDGDFMMSAQELATAARYDIPVIYIILNNAGFISIRDGQDALLGRNIGSEWRSKKTGEFIEIDYVAMAKSCGIDFAHRVTSVEDIGHSIKRALDANAPALIEVSITRDPTISAALVVGWWEFPVVPTAPQGVGEDNAAGRAAEQHQGRDVSDAKLVKPLGNYG